MQFGGSDWARRFFSLKVAYTSNCKEERRNDHVAEEKSKSVDLVDDEHHSAIAQHRRVLTTKTVQLKQEGASVRYVELGDPTKPTVELLHGVPENLHAWYAVAPLLAEN